MYSTEYTIHYDYGSNNKLHFNCWMIIAVLVYFISDHLLKCSLSHWSKLYVSLRLYCCFSTFWTSSTFSWSSSLSFYSRCCCSAISVIWAKFEKWLWQYKKSAKEHTTKYWIEKSRCIIYTEDEQYIIKMYGKS